ncbi:MAG TPA: septal ring lytic transglycosylase RlpA family protein [Ramlibacter sp.]|nr:septal ring lytic transglycosylase RlpA family protein [Ramlibacter sp.]
MRASSPCFLSLCAVLVLTGSGAAQAAPDKASQPVATKQSPDKTAKPAARKKLDHSGQRRVGKASFYAPMFVGRPMANGKPMKADDDNAASRTLPLGTIAKVTNLENGQSTVVTIEDRGPYVDGRIVDLSPGSARDIGLTKRQGITHVEVAPIAVPQPDGSVKPGDGAPSALAQD